MNDTTRMAGSKLMWLLTDPIGEEVVEGSLGGLVAGLGLLGTDQSLEQVALQTASAMAGGIGVGMLGRRVGERIGDIVHAQPLVNQRGVLATMARMLGSETTASGVADQLRDYKGIIEESLINETSAAMAREAAENPTTFLAKHGISAEDFARLHPNVQAGRVVSQGLRMVENMDPQSRKQILDQALAKYEAVENAITRRAAGGMDEGLAAISEELNRVMAANPEKAAEHEKVLGANPQKIVDSMRRPPKPVTGRHVGRAFGRFLGDEIGVIGGLAAGGALAGALGIKSSKDQRIEELEQQLQRQGGRS